jgi:hypothetical protein
MDGEEEYPSTDIDALRAVPFAQRWELLKGELGWLYREKKRSYDFIQAKMRNKYDFDAK